MMIVNYNYVYNLIGFHILYLVNNFINTAIFASHEESASERTSKAG